MGASVKALHEAENSDHPDVEALNREASHLEMLVRLGKLDKVLLVRVKNKFALMKPRFHEGELHRQRLLESLVEFACDNLLGY